MGLKVFRKLQMGKETTPGTAVAATAIWRGEGTYEDQRKQDFPPEQVGIAGGVGRQHLTQLMAQVKMEETPLTFEQGAYPFAAGIKNVVTGVADGSGTDLIYAYPFPTTAPQTIKTFTLEVGDDEQEEEGEYGFVTDINIKGRGGADTNLVTMSADWLCRQLSLSTFTATPSLVAVQSVPFSKTKFFMDAIGGTMGATEKANTLVEFDVKIKTGFKPRFEGDGQYYFSRAFWNGTFECTAEIAMNYNTASKAQIANWRARTPIQLQLLIEGDAVATPGTAYTYKTCQIDLVGSWEKFTGLEDVDEGDVVRGTFRTHYHATPATRGQVVFVNELASLA